MTTNNALSTASPRPKGSLRDLEFLAYTSGKVIARRSGAGDDLRAEMASLYATARAHDILDGQRVISDINYIDVCASQAFGRGAVEALGSEFDSRINEAIQCGLADANAGTARPQFVLTDPSPEWRDVSRENPTNPYGVEDIDGELAKEVDDCHAPIALGLPIPDPVFLVDEFFERGEPYVLSGDGGLGKSYLALDLAMAVASGGYWLGRETTRGEVVTLFAEDSDGNTRRRALQVAELRGLSKEQTEGLHLLRPALFPNGAMLLDKDLQVTKSMRSLWSYMRRVQRTRKRKIDLLIVDSAARTFSGDHNDAACVMAYIEEMKKFTTAFGCAVIVLAHPPKNGGSDVAGSGQWVYGPRGCYLLRATSKDDEKSECVLECTKANGKKPRAIKLLRNDFGLLQRKPNETGGSEKGDINAVVLQLIDDLNKEPARLPGEEKYSTSGVTHSKGRGSNRNAATVMERLCPTFTVKEYTAAISRLVHSGDLHEVTVVVGRRGNGTLNKVERLQRNASKPTVNLAALATNLHVNSISYDKNPALLTSSPPQPTSPPQNEVNPAPESAPWKNEAISTSYASFEGTSSLPHSLRKKRGGEELGVHDNLRVSVGGEAPTEHVDSQSQAPLLSKPSKPLRRRGREVLRTPGEEVPASAGLAPQTPSASPKSPVAPDAKQPRPENSRSTKAKRKSSPKKLSLAVAAPSAQQPPIKT